MFFYYSIYSFLLFCSTSREHCLTFWRQVCRRSYRLTISIFTGRNWTNRSSWLWRNKLRNSFFWSGFSLTSILFFWNAFKFFNTALYCFQLCHISHVLWRICNSSINSCFCHLTESFYWIWIAS